MPDYSWEAPPWTGANASDALYQDHEQLLFCCALIEEMLPALRGPQDVDGSEYDEDAEPQLEGGLISNVPRLRMEAHSFLARCERDLGAWHEHVEAERTRDQACARIHHLVAGLLEEHGCPPLCSPCAPEEAVKVVRTALGGRAAEREAVGTLDALHQEISRYAEAVGTLTVESRSFWNLLTELEMEGTFLLRCMALVAPMRERRVPRAAPGEPDKGWFPLPFTGLVNASHHVRVLGAADAWLSTGCPRSNGHLVDRAAWTRRERAVRQDRARLVAVVERLANASVEVHRLQTLQGAYDELRQLCLSAIELCGLDARTLLEEQKRSLHGMAASIITVLMERDDPLARQARCMLTQAMALAPHTRPQPHGSRAGARPTRADEQVAQELLARLQSG